VAFSILFSGYTMTKEVYEKMMTGTKIHPSRVLARGIVGFAGAIVGGIVLAALLGIIALPTGPFAFVVAIIASLVGSIAGGIGAEWLFEWLVPMNGVGWATGDFLLGGLLGSIMGVFPGTISGYILARIVNARVQPPKMPPKAKTFLGKLENAGKIIWRKGKHWYEKEARESDYMWRGAFLGLFFGGLFIAMTFVYLFN